MSFYWICNFLLGIPFSFVFLRGSPRTSDLQWFLWRNSQNMLLRLRLHSFYRGFQPNTFQLIMERLSASLSLKPVVGNWCFKMFHMVSHALCCCLQWGDTFDDHPRCIILTIRLKQCQAMDLDKLRRIIYSCSEAPILSKDITVASFFVWRPLSLYLRSTAARCIQHQSSKVEQYYSQHDVLLVELSRAAQYIYIYILYICQS